MGGAKYNISGSCQRERRGTTSNETGISISSYWIKYGIIEKEKGAC